MTHRPSFAIALLFSTLCIASCNGQVDGRSSTEAIDTTSTSIPASSDTAQIAEYVVAAFEDSKGHLWFGTNGQGAARWDGTSLRYFSAVEGLIDNVVTGITEDSAGNLWFGTQAGASLYDGKTFTGFGPAERLSGAGCKVLVDRNGRYGPALVRAFSVRWETVPRVRASDPVIDTPSYKMVPGKVWDLFEDSKGNLWFGRDGYGACKYDPSAAPRTGGKTFTHFTKKDGLCSNNVASIAEDAQGNIWFGSITSDFPEYIEEGGVSRYDGKAVTQFPEVKGLDANDIYNLYADRAGNIWIGAIRVGAYRYDGASFTLFDQTDPSDLTKVLRHTGFRGGPPRHTLVRILRRAVPLQWKLVRECDTGRPMDKPMNKSDVLHHLQSLLQEKVTAAQQEIVSRVPPSPVIQRAVLVTSTELAARWCSRNWTSSKAACQAHVASTRTGACSVGAQPSIVWPSVVWWERIEATTS
ncbi:MAG: hypothetical protein IPG92_00080 [Flavobacteriales bacterium]|nr:hypothetical protein [Flavobacteriales bacterium]